MDGNAVQLGLLFFIGLLTLYVAVMGRVGSLLAAIIDPSALTSSSGTNSFTPASQTNTVQASPIPSFQQGSYQAMAVASAKQYGINPNIFINQIQEESGFQPVVVSPEGA